VTNPGENQWTADERWVSGMLACLQDPSYAVRAPPPRGPPVENPNGGDPVLRYVPAEQSHSTMAAAGPVRACRYPVPAQRLTPCGSPWWTAALRKGRVRWWISG